MKFKNFSILAVLALFAFSSALIVYFLSTPWSGRGSRTQVPMIADLETQIKDLGGFEIATGKNTLKVRPEAGTWVLASEDGFPADSAKVREFLLNVMEAKLVEPKTALKARHELLGLQDPAETGSNARLLKLTNQKGENIGEIILGRTMASTFEAPNGGTYVRKSGDDQTWLADRQIQAGLSLRDWVKTRLIDVPPSTIKKVRIELEGEAPFEIIRSEDEKQHQLSEMPSGKKLKYASSVDDIAEAVSLIEFKSVRKAGQTGELPVKGRAIFETDTGFKPQIEFRSDGTKTFVTVTVSGEGEAAKDVDDLKKVTAGWEFEVPQTELNGVLVKMSDLLEDAPA